MSDALVDAKSMKERLTTIMDTFLKDVLHPPLYDPDVGPAEAECHRQCMFQKKPQKNAGPDAATWTVMVPAAFLTVHAPYRPCDPIKHNMLAINMERWHLQPSLFSIHHSVFLLESQI